MSAVDPILLQRGDPHIGDLPRRGGHPGLQVHTGVHNPVHRPVRTGAPEVLAHPHIDLRVRQQDPTPGAGQVVPLTGPAPVRRIADINFLVVREGGVGSTPTWPLPSKGAGR